MAEMAAEKPGKDAVAESRRRLESARLHYGEAFRDANNKSGFLNVRLFRSVNPDSVRDEKFQALRKVYEEARAAYIQLVIQTYGADVAIKEIEKERSAFWWTRFTRTDMLIAGVGLGAAGAGALGVGRIALGMALSGIAHVVAKRGGNLFYWNKGNGDSSETNKTASLIQEKWAHAQKEGLTFEQFCLRERKLVKKYARGLKLDRYGKIAFVALPGLIVAGAGVRDAVLSSGAEGINQATGTNVGEFAMRGENLVVHFSKLVRTTLVAIVGNIFSLFENMPSVVSEAKAGPIVPTDDPRLGGSPEDMLLARGELTRDRLESLIRNLSTFKKEKLDYLIGLLKKYVSPNDSILKWALALQAKYDALIEKLSALRAKFDDLARYKQQSSYQYGRKEWELRNEIRKIVAPFKGMAEDFQKLMDMIFRGGKGKTLVEGEWKDIRDAIDFKHAGGDKVPPELARGIREYVEMLHRYGYLIEPGYYDGRIDDLMITEGAGAKKGVHAPGSEHNPKHPTAFDMRCSRDPERVAYMLAIDQLVNGVYARFEIKGSPAELAALRKAVRAILLNPNGPYTKPPFNMTPAKADEIVQKQIWRNGDAMHKKTYADHFHVSLKKEDPEPIQTAKK